MRKSSFVPLLLFVATPAFAYSVSGTWQGKRYDFYISDTNISGSWGDQRSDFYTSSGNVSGTVAGSRINFYFEKTSISGQMPCGRSSYYPSGNSVSGTFCDKRFEAYLSSETEARDVALALAVDSVTDLLPAPLRAIVRKQIKF